MDSYYRNGELIDHKVKADEAIAAARKEGVEVEKVLVWRRHPGEYGSKSPMVEGRDFFVDELLEDYRGSAGRAGVDAGGGATVFDVHERHDWSAEGLPALDRRLSVLRDRHLALLPGHPSGRYVLVLCGHRLDHRPLLHRLRAAVARDDERDVRGGAGLSGRRAAVADRGAAGGEHLPYRADDDPDAAQAGAGGAREVRLSLQAHDDGRRADRARRLALVLPLRRQGQGGDRRYLVADRERRLFGQHAARRCSR